MRIALLLCLTLLSCVAQGEGWTAVYRHDDQGRPVAGDKQALFDAVRNGYDLRLGWGRVHPREPERTVEHMARPVWLTLVDGKELFVQIESHVLIDGYWNVKDQNFANQRYAWRAILATTGAFHAVVHDTHTGEDPHVWPQRVAITWFVDYPRARAVAKPLYEAPAMPAPAR